jgi:serine/threonine-protein kinase
LATTDGELPLLQLRGALNAYAVEPTLSDPMLRLARSDGTTEITRMNQLLVSTPVWADETSPRWAVNWLVTPSADVPASERVPEDYLQQDPSPPGFDERSLPTIPILPTDPDEATEIRSALRNGASREEL